MASSERHLLFHAFAWHADDGYTLEPMQWPTADQLETAKYTVRVFGRTDKGKSVCLNVTGFCPSFCLYFPNKEASLQDYLEIIEYFERKLCAKNEDDEWVRFSDHIVETQEPLIRRKNLWGFTGGELRTYYKFEFSSLWAYRKILGKLKQGEDKFVDIFGRYQLFDVVDPVVRFAHCKDLKTAGWIKVKEQHCKKPISKNTTCQIELDIEYDHIEAVDLEKIAPIVEMSYDIEVYSHDGSFPEPEDIRNPVFQIGVTLKRYNPSTGIDKRILLHFGPAIDKSGVPDTDVYRYDTERELLLSFRDLIIREDPDTMTGWNLDKFDTNYLFTRAEMLNCLEEFNQLSRIKGLHTECKYEEFSSSAYADNKYHRVHIPGRLHLDALIFVQRGVVKYDSYKLDNIAEKQLGDKKKPVSPQMIFKHYKSGDPKLCAIVGDYCIQDTVLVQLLIDKIDMVTQLFEMANITYTSVSDLLSRGQSAKVYSQITKKAMDCGFVTPFIANRIEEKSIGATVLEPEVGVHQDPVAVLDFASLYPTIMMAYNMDYSTIVLDKKYDNLPGVTYDTIEWTEEDGRKVSYRFAQGTESIIPELQRHMFTSRRRVKAMMKSDEVKKDPLRLRVLSGRELAIKVSMNSIYGFTKAFKLCLPALTGSVTAQGRKMIADSKHFMENVFPKYCLDNALTETLPNLRVVAGDTDSVFVKFIGFDIPETIKLATIGADMLTEHVFNRPPIEMEYEKVYLPLVLLKKKHYIARMYTHPDKEGNYKWKLDYKGVALKRRNYCNFAKDIYLKAVDDVLGNVKDGPQKAVQSVKEALEALKQNKVPYDQFVVTNSLKGKYKNPKDHNDTSFVPNLPHVQLAKRMKERDAGSAPEIGDRFGYVIVADFKNGEKVHHRSEDPQYAEEHGIPADTLYYLNQQVRAPVTDFLTIAGQGEAIEKVFVEAETYIKYKQRNAVQEGFRHRNKLQDISTFFKPTSKNKSPPRDNTDIVPPSFMPKKRRTKAPEQSTKITGLFGKRDQ